MSSLAIVLTSAGVAAFVSGLMTLAGQALERRARQRELALTMAKEFARARTELVKEIAFETGKPAAFIDETFAAAEYFNWIEHLLRHGELPPDARQKAEAIQLK